LSTHPGDYPTQSYKHWRSFFSNCTF
jgi:hypothetical protein